MFAAVFTAVATRPRGARCGRLRPALSLGVRLGVLRVVPGSGFGKGKPHEGHRSPPGGSLEGDLAAIDFGEPVHDREPQPRSGLLVVTAGGGVGTEPMDLLGGHPAAAIRNAQEAAAALRALKTDDDRRVGRREHQGVLHQLFEDRPQVIPWNGDGEVFDVDFEIRLAAQACGLGPHDLADEGRAAVEPRSGRAAGSGRLQLGVEAELGDDFVKPLARQEDPAADFPDRMGLDRGPLVHEQGGEADHCGQGGQEFVRERARDARFQRIEPPPDLLPGLRLPERGGRMGRLLLDLGYVTEVQICEVVAEQLQIPAADLVAVDVPNEVLALVPKELAVKYVCLPWFVDGRELYLIMADPTNVTAADAIAFCTGHRVKPVVAPESEIILALQRFYAAEETSLAQFENIDLAEQLSVVTDTERDASEEEDVEKGAQGAPLVKLVNGILADAIHAGASDIHIEPQEKGLNLRYRVDGLLRHVMTMPKRIQGKVISRIKITAHMDISERRKPQDGRTRLIVAGKPYDMRVSTLPTADDEKVVIRILVQDRAKVALEDLGFDPEVLATFKEMLLRPQGMVLVTGPTGSGKTSTLYAALNFLRHETTNIVTVEDPVEYRLAGVSQVAVSEKSGMTFAAGLRSILRQDPNVVMVGEIRDAETAQIAFQAAQTGHLVLSTLHTNDAPSAVTRLVEMGVPAYLVASSVIAVQAQRLVRRLCECKTVNPDGSARPKGCDLCRNSGFKGRTAIYELMRVTPRVRSVLLARASDDLVRCAARASGMRTMFMDGKAKADRGITVVEEVLRVVPPDDPDEPALETEEPPKSTIPATLSQEVRRARRTKILVVEDDLNMQELLREILTSEEYDVVTACDGREARTQIYSETPDLILTDLHLPGMDGLELLEKVRGDLSTRDVPVVFITGVESTDAAIQAFNLGADDYISKPIQANLLLSRRRRSLLRAHLIRAH